MRNLIAALCILVLSGCATTTRQYEWGEYEDMLYSGYKDPAKMEALMVGLESQIKLLEEGGKKVPPGLYAEVGTLYLQKGSQAEAIAMYGREREAWPESKGLMDALIRNLERQKNTAEEGSK